VNTPILENRPVRVTDGQKAAMAQPEDIAAMVVALARLPQRAHVPELIVKPLVQEYM
jgi:NADP-dependent 3-hydroxy acid dehydrogenase YdfG